MRSYWAAQQTNFEDEFHVDIRKTSAVCHLSQRERDSKNKVENRLRSVFLSRISTAFGIFSVSIFENIYFFKIYYLILHNHSNFRMQRNTNNSNPVS